MTAVASEITGLSNDDFMRIGAKKFSHFSTFGFERELDNICTRYDKYFFDTLTEKKDQMVECYKKRRFHLINNLQYEIDDLESSFFRTVVEVSKLHLELYRGCTLLNTIKTLLSKNISMLESVSKSEKEQIMTTVNIEKR